MSECVLPIEKPKTCKECFDKCRCFGMGEYFQDGTIWCGIAKGYLGEITKCPIIAIPEGHGRLVDAVACASVLKKLENEAVNSTGKLCYGYAARMFAEAFTIIAAERKDDGTTID